MSEWEPMEAQFDQTLVQAVRNFLNSGSSPYLAPEQFTLNRFSHDTVLELFEVMISAGLLERETILNCPAQGCTLTSADVRDGICPGCGENFFESGEEPVSKTVYISRTQLSREIPWLVAIHGFNTQGEWQEDFGWLLATRFRHRAPALMHKFPILRYGVLFRWKHRRLVRELELRLRKALDHAKASGISEPPDILAHSFGTLLFAKLLQSKEASDLRFGRVIVAGGIIRPDFDWKSHIDAGRIEAVLNHCSKQDHVVRFAQFFIPDSGPSGRHGFDDTTAINHREKNFDHGTHFEAEMMVQSLKRDGSWNRFFRLPNTSLRDELNNHKPEKRWKPTPRFFRLLCWIFVVTLPIIATILILVAARSVTQLFGFLPDGQ